MTTLLRILSESWLILGQMSPYLLFGFLVAGVLSVVISPAWVERNLGSRGFGPILKASLFGIPLPLCSCGVIPVAASIRHQGSSKAATTSFLLSTPQTGVDSIAITYGLLGPVFGIFRPLAALITGIIGGGLVMFFGSKKETDDTVEKTVCTDDCCVTPPGQNPFKRLLDYGLVRLPRDIGIALLIGVLIAGLMGVIVPKGFLEAYIGGGVLSILLMMLVGVPVYVCATASVPIAVGFMHMGASPGAALAFLIAGPATNAAAFTTTWNVLGRRTALLYLLTVAGSAVGFGLLLNWIMPLFETGIHQITNHTHNSTEGGWLTQFWAVAMLLVIVNSYLFLKYRNKSKTERTPELSMGVNSDTQLLEFFVTGMHCTHCADSIERGLTGVSGVGAAQVNLESGRVFVTGDNLDRDKLFNVVKQLGYEARE